MRGVDDDIARMEEEEGEDITSILSTEFLLPTHP